MFSIKTTLNPKLTELKVSKFVQKIVQKIFKTIVDVIASIKKKEKKKKKHFSRDQINFGHIKDDDKALCLKCVND